MESRLDRLRDYQSRTERPCFFIAQKSGGDMKQAIPFEQAVYLFAQSYRDKHFKGIAGVFNADEEPDSWITLENGAHIPLDESGEALGGAGGWAEGKDFSETGDDTQKQKKIEISPEMKPKAEYKFFDDNGQPLEMNEWMNENVDALMDTYEEGGKDALELEYWKGLTEYSSKDIHKIDKDPKEVHEEFIDAIGDDTLAHWFVQADPGYKPKIVKLMLFNPEARNMALNQMYSNYEEYIDFQNERNNTKEKPKSFEEFITTPVKLYRGGSGETFKKAATFSAYTFDKKIAEGFAGKNGKIYELSVKPIDTWGGWMRGGEYEVMVPYWIAPNGNADSAQDSKDIRRDGRSSPIPYDAKTLAFLFGIKQNSVIKGRATCSFS
jgi:hypothetical protein